MRFDRSQMDVMAYDLEDRAMMENGGDRQANKRQRIEAAPGASTGWAS